MDLGVEGSSPFSHPAYKSSRNHVLDYLPAFGNAAFFREAKTVLTRRLR